MGSSRAELNRTKEKKLTELSSQTARSSQRRALSFSGSHVPAEKKKEEDQSKLQRFQLIDAQNVGTAAPEKPLPTLLKN